MKKLCTIVCIISGLILVFMSCNKYEDGPTFTILSATKRIIGTWELTETTVNDTVVSLNDLTSLLGDIDMDSLTSGMPIDMSQVSVTSVKATFEKDGDGNFFFAISAMGLPLSRTEFILWEFDDEKENVEITIMNELQSFRILRLTNKELWLTRSDTQDGLTTTTVMKLEKEKD